MSIESFIAWLGVMVPLMISPGPANIVLAGAGMKQGVRNSIPLVIGINTVLVVYSIIIGLGLGEFIKGFPELLFGIKIVGILYILYLSYKFLIAKDFKANNENAKVYSFFDGLLLQLLNPKGFVLLVLMFSLFLNPNKNQVVQVTYLIVMLIALGVVCHFIWVAGGSFITKLIKNNRAQKILNYIFSLSLALVAVWLLVDAIRGI